MRLILRWIINAVALSHREHRWVNLPLDGTPS